MEVRLPVTNVTFHIHSDTRDAAHNANLVTVGTTSPEISELSFGITSKSMSKSVAGSRKISFEAFEILTAGFFF